MFPNHGQEGRGNYFSQIKKAYRACRDKDAQSDIEWSLYDKGNPRLRTVLKSGFLFFPGSMKQCGTGVKEWEREKNAAVSPWCFLLAMRGAMLFRGGLHKPRWGRRAYPSFPFVFEGSTIQIGKNRYFNNVEVHLPTWTADHPRTLAEFEIQMRQFQARLSNKGFVASAAEFRVAVRGRGSGAAFDAFHRFVLEGRRPSNRDPMRQAIPRGVTRVRERDTESVNLRYMLAPLAETGWFDQFNTDRLRAAMRHAEDSIHRAVDEPGRETYQGILEALWDLNRKIILPGALRKEFEDRASKRLPRPLPPLPARQWEAALESDNSPAHRIGRAIGSIIGIGSKGEKGKSICIGPILEHMLPVKWDWDKSTWIVPPQPPARLFRWSGLRELDDFAELFWYRWLDAAELPCLAFDAMRTAFLEDIVALLRGDIPIREIHRLASLYALLDWEKSKKGSENCSTSSTSQSSPTLILPAYAVLRLWLELGIRPAPRSQPPRDGSVAKLLSFGSSTQVKRAVRGALARLRITGLPWEGNTRPMGKAIADFNPSILPEVAARMALAVIVPISQEDTKALSRRLWVPIDEMEVTV